MKTKKLSYSQYILICWISQKLISWRKCFTHISSHVSDVTVLYSDSNSTLDQATKLCSLIFQEIMLAQHNIQ